MHHLQMMLGLSFANSKQPYAASLGVRHRLLSLWLIVLPRLIPVGVAAALVSVSPSAALEQWVVVATHPAGFVMWQCRRWRCRQDGGAGMLLAG